ncbi:cullin-1-like [Paramacrobiotus metropolitanus]|uniref:cullin-1-like n=1 Tax=Paramacrobiotus metropolitanus TaxID=2943436 RepID=UPI0024460098|nr:cullin-1-like [Paramacrobiotus metropolitanus]
MPRMVIKMPLPSQRLEPTHPVEVGAFFDRRWSEVKEAIDSLLARQYADKFFSDLHTIMYEFRISSHRLEYARRIYQSVYYQISLHLSRVYDEIFPDTLVGSEFLKTYVTEWEKFQTSMKSIEALELSFHSLWVYYGKHQKNFMQIGHEIWKHSVVESLGKRLTDPLIAGICCDWENNATQHSGCVKTVVTSLITMDGYGCDEDELPVYSTIFELPFLLAMRERCEKEVVALTRNATSLHYLHRTSEFFDQEIIRSSDICHKSTIKKLHALRSEVLGEGLASIFLDNLNTRTENLVDNLLLMYQQSHLFTPEERASRRRFLLATIEEKTTEFLETSSLDMLPVFGENSQELLELHNLAPQTFRQLKAAETAFRFVVNREQGDLDKKFSLAETLVAHYDQFMRKNPDIDRMDAILEPLMLCQFLEDNRSFYECNIRKMARRLLLGRRPDLMMENVLIDKLCKNGADSKEIKCVKRLVNDIESSRSLMTAFLSEVVDDDDPSATPRSDCELFVNVLTPGVWPIPKEGMTMTLPPDILLLVDRYSAFYTRQTGRSTLNWMYKLGFVDVQVNYLRKPLLITMDMPQYAICAAFNDIDQMDVESLKLRTGIVNEECWKKAIAALVDVGIFSFSGHSLLLKKDFSPKRSRSNILTKA